MSAVAGLHVPVIPLEDVAGSEGAVLPEQIVCDVPISNMGVTIGLTVTANVVGKAHWPASGVNV